MDNDCKSMIIVTFIQKPSELPPKKEPSCYQQKINLLVHDYGRVPLEVKMRRLYIISEVQVMTKDVIEYTFHHQKAPIICRIASCNIHNTPVACITLPVLQSSTKWIISLLFKDHIFLIRSRDLQFTWPNSNIYTNIISLHTYIHICMYVIYMYIH